MTGLSILGTGGYLLPVVKSEPLLKFLKSPKNSDWILEKTGIEGHSLNFDPKTGKKITAETCIDYAEQAALEAIENAGIKSEQVDHICLATCTPSQIHFMADAIELHRRLGLRRDAVIDQIDGGCAALAKGFQLAEIYSRGSAKYPDFYTLIVGANDVASFINRHRYRSTRPPAYCDDAWLSPVIFSDGAGALVLGPGDGSSLMKTHCALDGAHPLVSYKGGGAVNPTRTSNLDSHAYVMDAKDVAAQFLPAIDRTMNFFLEFLKRQNRGIPDVERWYIHQANFRFIQKFSQEYKIPMDKIPHNIDRIGNTVSASTLLLLDEDVKNERFPKEGPVIFLFVGAGMMEGGALFLK